MAGEETSALTQTVVKAQAVSDRCREVRVLSTQVADLLLGKQPRPGAEASPLATASGVIGTLSQLLQGAIEDLLQTRDQLYRISAGIGG
jgi:hypothetical protein